VTPGLKPIFSLRAPEGAAPRLKIGGFHFKPLRGFDLTSEKQVPGSARDDTWRQSSLRGLESLGALDEDAGQVLAVVVRQDAPQKRDYGGYRQAHAVHQQVIGEDVY
jgi:hypothetical protein